MKKAEKINRKSLKTRLSGICMIYLADNELSEKKKEKLKHYADKKVNDLVDYYTSLLKKPERSTMGRTTLQSPDFLEVLQQHNLMPTFHNNLQEIVNNVEEHHQDQNSKAFINAND